jgi:hypothetical protein
MILLPTARPVKSGARSRAGLGGRVAAARLSQDLAAANDAVSAREEGAERLALQDAVPALNGLRAERP